MQGQVLSGPNTSSWEQDEEEQPSKPTVGVTTPGHGEPVQEPAVTITAGSTKAGRILAEHPSFVNYFVLVSHARNNRFHFFLVIQVNLTRTYLF